MLGLSWVKCSWLLLTHTLSGSTYVTSTSTSSATIDKLMDSISNHGLPRTIVSDNGSSFTSAEFHQFTHANGIQHITSSPYHPASNGLAERAVQTIKSGLKKMHVWIWFVLVSHLTYTPLKENRSTIMTVTLSHVPLKWRTPFM